MKHSHLWTLRKFWNFSQTEAGPEKLNTKFIWPILWLKLHESKNNKEPRRKRNFRKAITPHRAMKNSSSKPSSKRPFRGKKISLPPSGPHKNSLKAKSLMLQCRIHSVLEMEKRKKTKFRSDKKNLKSNWTKSGDFRTKPWNPFRQKLYPNMSNKTCTKSLWENKKESESKGWKDSDSKFRKACTPFHRICFQNPSQNRFMSRPKMSTNLLLNLCPGTAK